ncbi:unnamed protein product, partial [Ectocarpus fasciculatus]
VDAVLGTSVGSMQRPLWPTVGLVRGTGGACSFQGRHGCERGDGRQVRLALHLGRSGHAYRVLLRS